MDGDGGTEGRRDGGMEGCATALSEEQELDADREWQASGNHLRCAHRLNTRAVPAPWHNRNTKVALAPCPGGLNS